MLVVNPLTIRYSACRNSCCTHGIVASDQSPWGSYVEQFMWDKICYNVDKLPIHVDTTLSRVILRPDCEVEHKADFVKALELYHYGQYSAALDKINQYFTKDDQ